MKKKSGAAKARNSPSKSAKAKAKTPARRVASAPARPPSRPGRGAPPPRIGRAAHPGKAGANKGAVGRGVTAKGAAAAKGSAASKKPARLRVRICKNEGCSNAQTTGGFCRLHYLANWRKLRDEKAKRAQKNLDRYVERMAGTKKPNPDEEEAVQQAEGGQQKEEAVFEEDFGEFVDVLSREENLDKILNGIKVEDY